MKDTKFIDGLIAGLKSPNFIKRRRQVKGDYLTDHGYHFDFECRPTCSSCCGPAWNSFNGHTRSCNERWEEYQQTHRPTWGRTQEVRYWELLALQRREQMFTHRYLVLGITEDGYVDQIVRLRSADSKEICELALERVNDTRRTYRQLVLISIGKDNNKLGNSLNVQMHRIEPAPPIPQPTFTLQPIQAYFG